MANNDKNKLISMGGQFIIDEDQKEIVLEKIKDWSDDEKKSNDLKLWKVWFESYSDILLKYWNTFKNRNDACQQSLQHMRHNNPRIVLRNYLAEIAIKAAEKNDFSVCQTLLEMLQNPFSDEEVLSKSLNNIAEPQILICERPPNWAHDIKVT